MSREVLKAVKDWCMGKFQTKGNYLTSVPEEYVTDTKLTVAFMENMSGVKIGQDPEGNWGYIVPDTDVVIPFGSGSGKTVSSSTEIADAVPVYVAINSTVADGYEQIND